MEDTELSKLKEATIARLNERMENNSLTPEDRDALVSVVNLCPTKDAVMVVEKLGTTYNKRGITFRKRYEIMSDKIAYLKRNEKYSFFTDPNAITHKLIVGDNYYALFNLLVSYRGLVDVIYIDPPYGMNSASKCASTNYRNTYTRDDLLSDLYSRLVLAKQLLSENGIIFCSIDDKNQAYIKCLFDDIFGEENFIACCPRQTTGSRTTKSKSELQTLHDYVLVYKQETCKVFTQNIVGVKTFPYSDERGEYYLVPLQDNGPHGTRTARPNLYYPIYRKKDGTLTLDKTDDCFLPHEHKHDDGRWMWSKKKFESDKDDLTIDHGEVKIKHYKQENEDTNKYQAFKTWLPDYRNSKGTEELKEILGTAGFSNPKPTELIKWCVNLCNNKNAIVLDFYAGSGTTGQAVLDLNQEDGGHRRFILCNLNEVNDDGSPNNIAYDITAERLRRIMTGTGYDGNDNFPWIRNYQPYGDNLEVLDIADISDSSPEVFKVIDETLYGIQPFTNIEDKVAWVCKNFNFKQKAVIYGGKETNDDQQ